MTDLLLYYAPDSCARVTMIALEEIGVPYRTELIAFVRGDHRSAEYLRKNPAGKVPVLVIDGEPLAENPAILLWLADRYPEARLLPEPTDALQRVRIIADLTHCAANLHPLVTRLRIPQYFCDLPETRENVFALAHAAMDRQLAPINALLGQQRWWYGDTWSVVDAYVNWIWFRIIGAGFDGSKFEHLSRHDQAMRERPSVQRTVALHREAAGILERQGHAVSFEGRGAIVAAR